MRTQILLKKLLKKLCVYTLCGLSTSNLVTAHIEQASSGTKIQELVKALVTHKETQFQELLSAFLPEELNVSSQTGSTLMHHVIVDDLEWAVPLLIKAGIDIEVGDKKGNSPLHYALYLKKPALFKLLLKSGAHPNLANSYGITLLHEASRQGDNNTVKLLLAYKAEPNRTDDKGRTPLFYAAQWGDLDTVKLLMNAGADSSLRNNDGENAAHAAAAGGSLPIVNFLLEQGIAFDIPDTHKELPIHKALRYGKAEVAKKLFEENLLSDQSDMFGENALHWLSFYDNGDELFDLVLAQYPHLVNSSNLLHQTPLHTAAAFAKKSTVAKLLKAGANPLAKDYEGSTPLDYARGYNQVGNEQLIEQALRL